MTKSDLTAGSRRVVLVDESQTVEYISMTVVCMVSSAEAMMSSFFCSVSSHSYRACWSVPWARSSSSRCSVFQESVEEQTRIGREAWIFTTKHVQSIIVTGWFLPYRILGASMAAAAELRTCRDQHALLQNRLYHSRFILLNEQYRS